MVEASVAEAFAALELPLHRSAGAAHFHVLDPVPDHADKAVPMAADHVVHAVLPGQAVQCEIPAVFAECLNPVGPVKYHQLGFPARVGAQVLFQKL